MNQLKEKLTEAATTLVQRAAGASTATDALTFMKAATEAIAGVEAVHRLPTLDGSAGSPADPGPADPGLPPTDFSAEDTGSCSR